MVSGPVTSRQKEDKKVEAVTDLIILGSKITVDGDYSHEIKTLAPWKKNYNKPRKHNNNKKKQRHHFAHKGSYCQSYRFSSSHVRMWELDHREGWAPKNWYFHIVVLENTLESPLKCKEIKPVDPKGNQSWIFIRRTDAEGKAPDVKSQLIGKDHAVGKDWRQIRRGCQRMRWLNGITNLMNTNLSRLWQTVEERSLVCYSPQHLKE